MSRGMDAAGKSLMLPDKASAFEANFAALIKMAAEANASDLHIDPVEDGIRIRLRVDGVLRVVQDLRDPRYVSRFFQQAKRSCGFNMGRIGVPQDARFRASVVPYDLRASLLPTLYGEKIVLRLLQRDKHFSLASYPMPEAAKDYLRRALTRWQGLILITGPTGSGKTTLLYSALSEIDPVENNIHTLEDPVEYTLPGIIQTGMAPGEVNFAGALRALMRQDPDAILVGEIRDEETAGAVMHAVSTGHLVLSSVHANSASESVKRLEALGIPSNQVEDALLFASAQRLVPVNCPTCARPDPEGAKMVGQVFHVNTMPLRGEGCTDCHWTGVRGRTLLFECMTGEARPGTTDRYLLHHGSLREMAFELVKEGTIHAETACTFE